MRSGSQDQSVDVLVEIPRGSRTKFDEVPALHESNKSADVKGWHDADVAWKLIADARTRARGQRREP